MTCSAGPSTLLCQVAPGGIGTLTSYLPPSWPSLKRAWFTQSWTWNWIQAAARMLSERAGMKLWRASSSRLTTTGFGVSNRSGR